MPSLLVLSISHKISIHIYMTPTTRLFQTSTTNCLLRLRNRPLITLFSESSPRVLREFSGENLRLLHALISCNSWTTRFFAMFSCHHLMLNVAHLPTLWLTSIVISQSPFSRALWLSWWFSQMIWDDHICKSIVNSWPQEMQRRWWAFKRTLHL